MLGFGAGAWMLAMHRRDLADAACADAVALEESAPQELGCACSTGASPFRAREALVLVALAALVARRRSRSPVRDGRSS
jgi:MYXO-CTERM domain-containing protein